MCIQNWPYMPEQTTMHCCPEGCFGYFSGRKTWCHHCHFKSKWNTESSWHLMMIPHEQSRDMSCLFCLHPGLRLSAWKHTVGVLQSFQLLGEFFSQNWKELLKVCVYLKMSAWASILIAKSGWTVPLNKLPGHNRQPSLMMFDVSAHWISFSLETQSQEEMNPLQMSPGEVLHFFLHLHHLSKSRSHSTSQPVEYIKREGCRKCILKLFKSVADKYPGLNHSAGAELVLRQNWTSPCSRSYPGSSITHHWVIMHVIAPCMNVPGEILHAWSPVQKVHNKNKNHNNNNNSNNDNNIFS